MPLYKGKRFEDLDEQGLKDAELEALQGMDTASTHYALCQVYLEEIQAERAKRRKSLN